MFQLFKKKPEREKLDSEPFSLYPFLKGDGADDLGRTYSSILHYSDILLERDHSYIQRVFPTNRASMRNSAPLVTTKEASTWGLNPNVNKNLHMMLMRMLLFYGFELVSVLDKNEHEIVLMNKSDRVAWILHKEKADQWLKEGNHNLCRISRMLESLRLFRMKSDHESLSELLQALADYKPEIKKWSCWSYWEEYMRYED